MQWECAPATASPAMFVRMALLILRRSRRGVPQGREMRPDCRVIVNPTPHRSTTNSCNKSAIAHSHPTRGPNRTIFSNLLPVTAPLCQLSLRHSSLLCGVPPTSVCVQPPFSVTIPTVNLMNRVKTLNIEAGMPTVEQARQILLSELKQTKQSGLSAVKVIPLVWCHWQRWRSSGCIVYLASSPQKGRGW